MNASEQGTAAARNLLGAAEAYSPVPFMWSDQYKAKLQAYGIFPAGCSFRLEIDETTAAGSEKCIVTSHYEGRLVGAIGLNAAKDLRGYRQRVVEAMAQAA